MDDLETGWLDAAPIDAPPSLETLDSQTPVTEAPEKEPTDEELKEEIVKLQEEVKKEEDAKEKRHKEQDIGWKQKIIKEREKAKVLEAENRKVLESKDTLEKSLIEEAYSKTIDDNFGLPYFENLSKTNPELADKLAKEKWGKRDAKELILDTKRTLAGNWDEEAKKLVSEEDIRSAEREKVYHEIALEQAQTMFDDLEESEKVEAKEYFDDIAEGKKLTPSNVKKYAEMAKFYATRNRKVEEPKKTIDKDQLLADKASTGIAPKSDSKSVEVWSTQAIRTQLLNAGVPAYQVNLMYPLN